MDQFAGPYPKEVRLLDEGRYDGSIAKIMQAAMSLKFEDFYLEDILNFIRTSYDINLVVDYRVVKPPKPALRREQSRTSKTDSPRQDDANTEKAKVKSDFLTDGMIRPVTLSDVQIQDLLTAMLRPLNLAYAIEGNFVWISSPEMLAKEDFNPPDTNGASEQLLDALNKSESFEIKETTVASFLLSLQRDHEIDALVDSRVVSQSEPVIRRFTVEDVRLHSALTVFLRKIGLAYALDGDHIIVSTPEFLEESIREDVLAPPENLKRATGRSRYTQTQSPS